MNRQVWSLGECVGNSFQIRIFGNICSHSHIVAWPATFAVVNQWKKHRSQWLLEVCRHLCRCLSARFNCRRLSLNGLVRCNANVLRVAGRRTLSVGGSDCHTKLWWRYLPILSYSMILYAILCYMFYHILWISMNFYDILSYSVIV